MPAMTSLKSPISTSSGSNVPVKGILKTPGIGNMTVHIQSQTSECEGEDDSESQDGDESAGVGDSVLSSEPSIPQTSADKGRRGIRQARELDSKTLAESYFEAQATKVQTSDRTLAKLKTPRLTEADVSTALVESKLKYQAETLELL